MSIFLKYLLEHNDLFKDLDHLDSVVSKASDIIVKSFDDGGKLLIAGNGGSASDSQHIASEFTGRLIKDRRPLPALSLVTDTSALTCIPNDYSFDDVFSRQISALGNNNDVFMGITTSGNSGNIINAFKCCQDMGITTIALLGKDGGLAKDFADVSIIIPSNTTARIQEAHILVGHAICANVESSMSLV